MKIVTVIGARPQFIKASPISRAFSVAGYEEVLIHTGQHYDYGMSQVFFEELGIPQPDINLGVGSGSHAVQTAEMLIGLEEVLVSEKPDWVLLFGDTNSTVAGALAAAKLHIRVAHVEAGLRSFNRKMPEEINRIVADAVSSLLFAPTDEAVRNLCTEGVPSKRVHLVGDVMYDAALMHGDRAESFSTVLETVGVKPKQFVLATVHRAENTDNPERTGNIFDALSKVSNDIKVVLPLHPRTRGALERMGILENVERHLIVTAPVGYLDMIKLEKNAALIATDSGGVQKEAFFHRVPCVTMRDETEWVELVDLGWNCVCPPLSTKSLVDAVSAMIGATGSDENPYGKGHAAEEIAHIIADTQ